MDAEGRRNGGRGGTEVEKLESPRGRGLRPPGCPFQSWPFAWCPTAGCQSWCPVYTSALTTQHHMARRSDFPFSVHQKANGVYVCPCPNPAHGHSGPKALYAEELLKLSVTGGMTCKCTEAGTRVLCEVKLAVSCTDPQDPSTS